MKLQAEVAEKYSLPEGHQVAVIEVLKPHRITVDLATLTLDEADKLIAQGFTFLLPKKNAKSQRPKAKKENDQDKIPADTHHSDASVNRQSGD